MWSLTDSTIVFRRFSIETSSVYVFRQQIRVIPCNKNKSIEKYYLQPVAKFKKFPSHDSLWCTFGSWIWLAAIKLGMDFWKLVLLNKNIFWNPDLDRTIKWSFLYEVLNAFPPSFKGVTGYSIAYDIICVTLISHMT